MPNGVPLREWKERGRKVVVFGSFIAIPLETILVLALGSLFGIAGLGAAIFLVMITFFALFISLQNQVDAIDGAIRGTKDESTYSDEVHEHLRNKIGKM